MILIKYFYFRGKYKYKFRTVGLSQMRDSKKDSEGFTEGSDGFSEDSKGFSEESEAIGLL